jgi:mannose-6-phosphate isomerase-like protein (cupin superfamily)
MSPGFFVTIKLSLRRFVQVSFIYSALCRPALGGKLAERQFYSSILTSVKMEKINLAKKLSLFSEHQRPKIVGELNGQMVKLVKLKGPFIWHHHDNEDELFYVVKGSFDMEFENKTVTINEGEFIIVPRGVEHRPNAKEECEIMLFEPATTLNTGNVENERTVRELESL